MKRATKMEVTYATMSVLFFALTISMTSICLSLQWTYGITIQISARKAPIATSGDSVYVAWSSNKTGNNDEIMFKASADGGKTWSNKMNLSNTPKSDSHDAQIAAAGNNVYVTWWERNQTMNEPVMRASNDNGKSFGEVMKLSGNSTAPG